MSKGCYLFLVLCWIEVWIRDPNQRKSQNQMKSFLSHLRIDRKDGRNGLVGQIHEID